MNTAWLLRSRTIWWALGLSTASCMGLLLFSPEGLPGLRKREAEYREARQKLLELNRQNRELLAEVQRLKARDPELMEALARRQGLAQPGETIYTFRDRPK